MSTLRNSLQAGIASLDQGAGQTWLRILMLLLLGGGIYGAHAWSQFRGLKDPQAMEYAQLARHVADGRGFTTDCVRPVDLWRLKQSSATLPEPGQYPDLRHGPVWPALVAAGFNVGRPSFTPPLTARLYEPERSVIVPLGILLLLATGLLVLLLGTMLFSYQAGITAAAMMFLNPELLNHTVSGSSTPAATFLITAAISMVVLGVRLRNQARPWGWWLLCLILGALATAAAGLTLYSAFILVPVLLLWLRIGFDTPCRGAIPVYILVLALAVAPWLLRNQHATGGIFGLAPCSAIQESVLFPDDTFERSLEPSLSNTRVAQAVKRKFRTNLQQVFERGFGMAGAGILAAFFIASLLSTFEEAEAERLKWHVLLAIFLTSMLVALQGLTVMSLFHTLFPVVLVLGTGYFFVLANRLSAYQPALENALPSLLVVLGAVPFLLEIAGGRASVPYPPYYPALNAYAAQTVRADEMICTDIPEATAWYGQRPSILLPNTIDEFLAMRGAGLPCQAIYLTSETEKRPRAGTETSWQMILDRKVPEGFPLGDGIDLPPGTRDQYLLIERPAGQTGTTARLKCRQTAQRNDGACLW